MHTKKKGLSWMREKEPNKKRIIKGQEEKDSMHFTCPLICYLL